MPRQKPPTRQPAVCHCNRKVDTPAWVGARRTGSGLGQRSAPAHGNPFARTGACPHSELQRTAGPLESRKKKGTRLRIA